MKLKTPNRKFIFTRTAFTWDIYDTPDGYRWLGVQVRIVRRDR